MHLPNHQRHAIAARLTRGTRLWMIGIFAVLLAACGGSSGEESELPTPVPTLAPFVTPVAAAPTAAPTVAATAIPTPVPLPESEAPAPEDEPGAVSDDSEAETTEAETAETEAADPAADGVGEDEFADDERANDEPAEGELIDEDPGAAETSDDDPAAEDAEPTEALEAEAAEADDTEIDDTAVQSPLARFLQPTTNAVVPLTFTVRTQVEGITLLPAYAPAEDTDAESDAESDTESDTESDAVDAAIDTAEETATDADATDTDVADSDETDADEADDSELDDSELDDSKVDDGEAEDVSAEDSASDSGTGDAAATENGATDTDTEDADTEDVDTEDPDSLTDKASADDDETEINATDGEENDGEENEIGDRHVTDAAHLFVLVNITPFSVGETVPVDDGFIVPVAEDGTAELALAPGAYRLRLQLTDADLVALETEEHAEIVVAVRADAPDQAVRFAMPSAHAVVPPEFDVVMAASGLSIEPIGSARPNAGHFHILINDDFVEPGQVIPTDATHLHFGAGQLTATVSLEPGVHVLRLQLADGLHVARDGQQYRDTITVTVEADAPRHQVYFVEPEDGATVPPTFPVRWAATGLLVEPIGAVLDAGRGHFHVLINEEFVAPGEVVPTDAAHRHFGAAQMETELTLEPGAYTLRLQMANGAHITLDGEEYRDEITVTVAADENGTVPDAEDVEVEDPDVEAIPDSEDEDSEDE